MILRIDSSAMTNTKEDFSNFQFILNNWIFPTIDKLYLKMDEEFISKCSVKKRTYSEYTEMMEKYYQDKRNQLKSDFYGIDSTNQMSDHYMDFHKLCAIICRTLIEYKMIDFDVDKCLEYIEHKNIKEDNTQWLIDNALINFKIAFYASVVFLYQSMLFRFGKSNNESDKIIFKKLKNSLKLNLYYPSLNQNKHESFVNCMILDLAKRDINDRSFDFFMYSIIMYQLEEYNIQLIKSRTQ